MTSNLLGALGEVIRLVTIAGVCFPLFVLRLGQSLGHQVATRRNREDEQRG